MTYPRRVLVISYVLPTRGGIATWAGILRRQPSGKAYAFQFLEIPARTGHEVIRRIAQALDTIRLLARLLFHLASGRDNLVHVNCCLSAVGVWRDLAAALLTTVCGVPVVVHYHGSLPDVVTRLAAPSRFALHWLIDLAGMNIGVTRESVAWLAQRTPAKATYLPNFIEDHWLHPAAEAARQAVCHSAHRPEAIYVGRLCRDKGTFDLLRVAKLLPRVDFVLVGEVLEEARSAISDAPANVRFLGPISRREVIERLCGSDMFVFPSYREAFPNAVLEAMAAGLPVVGTRVGEIGVMIAEGEGGCLVEPGDVPALVAAVHRLAGDSALARTMGTFNRAVCETRYTVSAVFPDLVAIYDAQISRRRPSARVACPGSSADEGA